VLIDQVFFKSSVHNYLRNISDYRKSNLMRALTILSLYESQRETDSPISATELTQMQAHLALTQKTFGGLVDKFHFRGFHQKETAAVRDSRGHNWEILRQQAEASGLYFEPLSLSENMVTHALLWFPAESASNEASQTDHLFEGRFLNIKNPWRDQRLKKWKGYTEPKYFSAKQSVNDSNPSVQGDRTVKMIPLALYGLDFDRIPAQLIDFRNSANPRRRELSGRLINDVTRDVLSMSRFGNIYYLLARSAFDFVTSRRGIDVNQPSRLRSAAELRLLVSLNGNLSDGLRKELNKGLDDLSINPLEHRNKTDEELASAQYDALQSYALRPDGLPARLERERGEELAALSHRGLDGKLLKVANILTLGRFVHREKVTPELNQLLNKERQLAYHTRLLREIAKSSPTVEVVWNVDRVLPSLSFVAEHGSKRNSEAAKAVVAIFNRTEDSRTKGLALAAMKRIDNKITQREMLRIYNDSTVAIEWRRQCAEYFQILTPMTTKAIDTEATASSIVEVPPAPKTP
jgi:hypothetical protein